jgi:hypothetical protein
MVIQALQKTNNRSIEAAVEFISKMSYQDPRREQMSAAAARPINATMKPGDSSSFSSSLQNTCICQIHQDTKDTFLSCFRLESTSLSWPKVRF